MKGLDNALLGFALVIVALVAAVAVLRALRTGVAGIQAWPLAVRAQRPVWFWLCAFFQAAIGTTCLWLVIRWLLSN